VVVAIDAPAAGSGTKAPGVCPYQPIEKLMSADRDRGTRRQKQKRAKANKKLARQLTEQAVAAKTKAAPAQVAG